MVVHWNLDVVFNINPEMLWQAAQPCTIGNIKACMFSCRLCKQLSWNAVFI
ncbi:hypothetical protein [Candidatus Marithrix sp. Canyon 246]|uniref:hypothetical protein n=1 Tax=Candidatus Marithrix sp. Canyon 246 TaxID=1827136 RepID=UPI001495CD87|nr:hypothetical protein [Candidatus Marithrix sp. Canyon 246]